MVSHLSQVWFHGTTQHPNVKSYILNNPIDFQNWKSIVKCVHVWHSKPIIQEENLEIFPRGKTWIFLYIFQDFLHCNLPHKAFDKTKERYYNAVHCWSLLILLRKLQPENMDLLFHSLQLITHKKFVINHSTTEKAQKAAINYRPWKFWLGRASSLEFDGVQGPHCYAKHWHKKWKGIFMLLFSAYVCAPVIWRS